MDCRASPHMEWTCTGIPGYTHWAWVSYYYIGKAKKIPTHKYTRLSQHALILNGVVSKHILERSVPRMARAVYKYDCVWLTSSVSGEVHGLCFHAVIAVSSCLGQAGVGLHQANRGA